MTEAQRDEWIRIATEVSELDAKVTPGPWRHAFNVVAQKFCVEADFPIGGNAADFDFIVHCRTAAPQLAESVRALVEEVETLKVERSDLLDDCHRATERIRNQAETIAKLQAEVYEAETVLAERDGLRAEVAALRSDISFNVHEAEEARAEAARLRGAAVDALALVKRLDDWTDSPTAKAAIEILSAALAPVAPADAPRDETPAPARTEVERTVEAIAAYFESLADVFVAAADGRGHVDDLRQRLERFLIGIGHNVTLSKPIPMRLPCPSCGEIHIDEGEFATRPHHTHACQHCGEVWRPAVVHTVGVRFLPGFKNEEPTR